MIVGEQTMRDPRFVIAYTIIIGFAAAYIHSPDDTMKGALIAGFAGAWGFYLGSSSSSHQQRDQVDKALDLAKEAAPAKPKPDISLEPGESKTITAENPEGTA